jgi:hypothetical protein
MDKKTCSPMSCVFRSTISSADCPAAKKAIEPIENMARIIAALLDFAAIVQAAPAILQRDVCFVSRTVFLPEYKHFQASTLNIDARTATSSPQPRL